MKADTAFSRNTPNPSTARVEQIGAILDKLDICKKLIELYPIDSRLALARQLLDCCADKIAELAEDGEMAAIRRAALPRPKRKRTFLERLDAVAFTTIVGLVAAFVGGWVLYSAGYHMGWWS